jgi:hypothetical protein
VKHHPEALTPEQLEIFRASARLVGDWDAYLARGAALALHLGHRRSVDLDWFTRRTIPPEALASHLQRLGYKLNVHENREGTFLGRLGEVQYSVFRYQYRLVRAPAMVERCAVASLPDIAAMKLSAIVGRATKRDYVDLHAIFNAGVTLSSALSAMRRKFPGVDVAVSLRALTHFADVERQAMPDMIAPTTWKEVKRGLVTFRDRGLSRQGPTR